jgi:hypothetical protein|tara:strand:- start:7042 stop:7290 length:249 start_codon:yes stop_codon:yes gene_type:complete
MTIEIETRGEKTAHGWRDVDGFIGPMQPGFGPRTDPKGAFPTGPDVGEQLSAFSCLDVLGNPFDYAHDAKPTIMLFFRSAVW